MKYIQRNMAQALMRIGKAFPIVLVTGARQTGKSTLLRHCLTDTEAYDLDNIEVFDAINSAPVDFFKYNRPPLILDEVQKAPHVFAHMKALVDANKQKGMYFLTGSEQFSLMESASESLSGRVGILTLQGLSFREKAGIARPEPFIPTSEYFHVAKKPHAASRLDIWEEIHRGDKPELFANKTIPWDAWYGSYVTTYLERDVRRITNVADLGKFQQFMRMVAARTATVLNYASIAHDLGISEPTAKKWLRVLEATNIIYLLKPYYNNLSKRETKSPKIHFLDTGLAAYLTRWTTPDALRAGAMSGNFFESFVVVEILKSFQNAGIINPPLYFYRDKEKREIDLLIEDNGILYPVEIKQASIPGQDATKSFTVIEKQAAIKVDRGCIVCMAERLMPHAENIQLVPPHCL